jgi:hypothetical protein
MAAPEPARAAPPPPPPPPPPPGADRVVKGEVDEALGAWREEQCVRAGGSPSPRERARQGERVTGYLPWGVAPGRAPAGLGCVGGDGSAVSRLLSGRGGGFALRVS